VSFSGISLNNKESLYTKFNFLIGRTWEERCPVTNIGNDTENSKINPRSDMCALGMRMRELINKRHPFVVVGCQTIRGRRCWYRDLPESLFSKSLRSIRLYAHDCDRIADRDCNHLVFSRIASSDSGISFNETSPGEGEEKKKPVKRT